MDYATAKAKINKQKRTYQMHQARKIRLSAVGLCCECGKRSAREGRKTCTECGKRGTEDRLFYLSMHVCPICRKNDLFGEEKMCLECRARINANNVERWRKAKEECKPWTLPEYQAKKARERSERLKAAGLCVRCGKRKARPDRTMCGICADKSSKWVKESRLRKLEGGDKECRE